MEKTAILLNGGRDYEVTPSAGADTYLTRLLGAEAAIRAVFFLHSAQDEEGRQRVSVFVGSQQVGYLKPDIEDGILAAVRACEMHEAAVRARGSFAISWDQPGKVSITVDLSDPEHLLSSPLSDQEPARVLEPETPEDAAPSLSASFEEAAALMDLGDFPDATPQPKSSTVELESSVTPGASEGWNGDYPDWPPPAIKPLSQAAPTSLGDAPRAPAPAPAQEAPQAQAYEPDSRVAQPGWLASRTPRSAEPDAPGEYPDTPSHRTS